MKSLFTSLVVIAITIQAGYAQLKVKEHVWLPASPTTNIPDSLTDNDAVMVHMQHDIKNNLELLEKKVDNKSIKIKINEAVSLIKELPKNYKVKDKDVLNLLQYLELENELNNIH